MPTLQQIHDTISIRSYFSRPDTEVWTAINAASRFVFQAVLNEDQMFWRTLDTTSVKIVPSQQEYQLPPDCIQLLRVRERLTSSEGWRKIQPVDIRDSEASDDSPLTTASGLCSHFSYQGPYLSQAVANDGADDQIYSIMITPIPADTRFVELVYSAKYTEVTAGTDNYTIPDELRDVIMDFSTSELLRGNNDDLSDKYAASAQAKLDMALTIVRARQQQAAPAVIPYMESYL